MVALPDGTLFVQLFNFIVFLAILNAIFFKPVGAAIAKRRAYIDGLKHDVEQLQLEAKTLRGQAEDRRAAARREAEEAIAQARVAAGAEGDTILAAAHTRSADIVAQAHVDAASELGAARAQEPRIVLALANEMVTRALGGIA